LRRVEKWASRETYHYEDVEMMMQALNTISEPRPEEPKTLYFKALEPYHDRLQAEQRSDRIESLESEFDQLADEATNNGDTYSWGVPEVRTMSPQLDRFLRSPEAGPKKVVGGGTVRFSRKLVRAGNVINSGYSADIVVTKGAGDQISVIVTKTRDFYKANAWMCKRDVKRLEWFLRVCFGIWESKSMHQP
jgi:hypothetical protein